MQNSFPARLLGRFAVASLALVPAAALAQAAAVAPAAYGLSGYSKTEAILGGTPSRLAQILAAQQHGRPAPALASLPIPAARSALPALPAIVRSAPLLSPAVTSGKPDIFGSVALAVPRTSLDARWRRVESARLRGSAAAYAAALRGRAEYARLDAVNRYVNGRVRFVDDSRQYGRADLWTAAADTLRRGRGDCEDYAIAKLQMLRAAGIADRDMYLVIVKDLVRRSDHAVLVVRAAGRMLVLDNGTDTILDTERVRDYRPVLTFAARGSWTHGYRRTVPPMTIAAADLRPLTPAANAN